MGERRAEHEKRARLATEIAHGASVEDAAALAGYSFGEAIRLICRTRSFQARLRLAERDHEIGRLTAERDALTAERDRLRRVLAVERGDASQAPEGWTPAAIGGGNHGDWFADNGPGHVYPGSPDRWNWYVRGAPGEHSKRGTAPTALEAMEAADAARSEAPDAPR